MNWLVLSNQVMNFCTGHLIYLFLAFLAQVTRLQGQQEPQLPEFSCHNHILSTYLEEPASFPTTTIGCRRAHAGATALSRVVPLSMPGSQVHTPTSKCGDITMSPQFLQAGHPFKKLSKVALLVWKGVDVQSCSHRLRVFPPPTHPPPHFLKQRRRGKAGETANHWSGKERLFSAAPRAK